MNNAKAQNGNSRYYSRHYRWVILACVSAAVFLNMFHRASSGVIKNPLTAEFGLSATTFSNFSAMYFYPYIIMQLPIGIMLDRFGPRKVLAGTSFLAAAGTLLFALSRNYTVACIARVMVGCGVCSALGSSQKLNQQWFHESRVATMIACASSFGLVGTLCAQKPLAFMVNGLGWHKAFAVIAGVSLVYAVLALVFVRNSPASVGLPPANHYAAPKGGAAKGSGVPLGQAIKSTMKNKQVYPLLIALSVQLGTYNLFSGTWGIPYLEEVFHLTTLEASTYTSALAFGSAIFGILLPIVSDGFKNRKIPLIVTFGLSTLLWLLLTFFSESLSSRTGLLVVMFFFGLSGCSTSQMYSMAREINDPNTIGVSFGLCNMIGMSASAYFPLIAGVLMDKYTAAGLVGGPLYEKALAFCAILSAVGLGAVFLTKETHCRNIVAAKQGQGDR